MTMPGDYSEELVELAPSEQVYRDAARAYGVDEDWLTQAALDEETAAHEKWFRRAVNSAFAAGQRAILADLSSSGRLVPEGSEGREEYGRRLVGQFDEVRIRRWVITTPWTPSEPTQEDR